MPKLPRALAEEHIKAFQQAGWEVVRITGSHHILSKKGVDFHLTIPYHKGRIIKLSLLKGLIRDVGLTNEEHLAFFYEKNGDNHKRKVLFHRRHCTSEGNLTGVVRYSFRVTRSALCRARSRFP